MTYKGILMLIATAFSFSPWLFGQEVSLSMGSDYNRQVFYSLNDDEEYLLLDEDWDLAFDTSPFGTTIRSNDGKGMKVYLYANGDTADWSLIDTTGLSAWPVLYNSDTSWYTGAFNRSALDFDVGWGNYDPITHQILGDSIYLISMPEGNWKKFWIEGLIDGAFQFRYANLDGSDEVETAVAKSDFEGKLFGYFNLSDNETINPEPLVTSWDLAFTSYVAEVAPGAYYGVTGAFLHPMVQAARVFPVADPGSLVDYESASFSQAMNVIGYDWKQFDLATYSYLMTDSLCYFVQGQSGDIWRIIFTTFEGSETGNLSFEKDLLTVVDIEENDHMMIANVFPNPASDVLQVLFDVQSSNVDLFLYDNTGRIVRNASGWAHGFHVWQVNVSDLPSGMYTVLLNDGSQKVRRQVIIQ